MRNLLVETTYPKLEIVESNGPLKVSGVASVVNQKNQNRRYYPLHIMEREIERIRPQLDSSKHVGMVDHPMYATSVTDLGLKFTDLRLEGNEVLFEAEIIPTARGRDLEAVIRAGVRVGVSSRGLGSVKTETIGGESLQVIQEDYELESFDVVVNPSVASARITQHEALAGALERLLDASTDYSVKPTNISEEPMNDEIKNQILAVRAEGIPTEESVSRSGDASASTGAAAPASTTTVAGAPTGTPAVTGGDAPAPGAGDTATSTPGTVGGADTTDIPAVTVTPEGTKATPDEAADQKKDAAQQVTVGDHEHKDGERPVDLKKDEPSESLEVKNQLTEANNKLTEEANIRLALAALASAISEYVSKGNYDAVASIASCASSLDYIDKYLTSGSYEALHTPEGTALADAMLAPIGNLATILQRDAAIVTATEGQRYAPRIQNLLRAECVNAKDVTEKLPAIQERVFREAVGGSMAAPIRGDLTTEQRSDLTPRQRRERELAGLPY